MIDIKQAVADRMKNNCDNAAAMENLYEHIIEKLDEDQMKKRALKIKFTSFFVNFV